MAQTSRNPRPLSRLLPNGHCAWATALVPLALVLSGCAGTPATTATQATAAKSLSLQGKVIGGQPPVTGATIQLYAVGTTGDGSAATPMLSAPVTSDPNGNFSITSLYSCTTSPITPTTEVYLVATGGNPGLPAGMTNPNISMMAALGQCSTLSTTTFVEINELTTTGSLAALYPYMSSYSSLGSGSGDAAAFASAFAAVQEYVNTTTGSAPGPSLPAGDYAATNIIEALADIVSSCINSAGGTAGDGSACGNLFSLATPSGGAAPTDTIGAILNILNNPTQNAAALFALIPSNPPFPTTLTAAPSSYAAPITYSIGGKISVGNICGGSTSTLPTFTVTLNTSPSPTQVTTDTDGNYLFSEIPSGTYTITPSIAEPTNAIFSPSSHTGVTVSNSPVSGENFNSQVGYTISGNVSYSGSQTGQVYYYLVEDSCNRLGPGGSITPAQLSSGGAFTIYGVQPGTYSLAAWMDSTGITSGAGYPGPQGAINTNDPTGADASTLTVTNGSLAGAGVVLSNPARNTPNANPSMQVAPNFGGVTIFYTPPTVSTPNGSPEEDANEYVVEWALADGTDSDGSTCSLSSGAGSSFTTVAGSHTFYAVGAGGASAWILDNTVAGSGTFTSGDAYCFQARSFNTLASTTHPSGWSSATDGDGNPEAFTLGAACSGTCTTVSGTVTIPAGVTIASGAPLYVGLYQQSPDSNGPSAFYGTEITSPVSGANDYSVTIPSGSNYYLVGILDQNNDGQIDAGDVTNATSNNSNSITVSGSSMSGVDVTLPGSNSLVTVQTEYCGSSCGNYILTLVVDEGNKLPVSVQLNSGPNLLNPISMSQAACCGGGASEFWYSGNQLRFPTVGDTYDFTVTYSDGTQDTGSTVNGAVTAFGSTGAAVSSSDVATNLETTAGLTPNFTWTFPANPSDYTYSFYLSQSNCSGSCPTIWQIPGQNSNSNGFTYAETETGAATGQITWGMDPTGGGSVPTSSLNSEEDYTWTITVEDSNGNQAQSSASDNNP